MHLGLGLPIDVCHLGDGKRSVITSLVSHGKRVLRKVPRAFSVCKITGQVGRPRPRRIFMALKKGGEEVAR